MVPHSPTYISTSASLHTFTEMDVVSAVTRWNQKGGRYNTSPGDKSTTRARVSLSVNVPALHRARPSMDTVHAMRPVVLSSNGMVGARHCFTRGKFSRLIFK